MTNGFRFGVIGLLFLGVMASAFGEAVLMHHDILCLPSLLWHSTGSSVGFIHISCGPKLVMVERETQKTATRLLLDVLGQTEPVLQ